MGPVGDVLHPQMVVADLVEQLVRGVEDERLTIGLAPATPRAGDRFPGLVRRDPRSSVSVLAMKLIVDAFRIFREYFLSELLTSVL